MKSTDIDRIDREFKRARKKEELIAEYAHEAVIGVVIFSAILASVYTVLHRRKLRRQQDLA